jgi:hypothetical protein
VDKTRSKEDFLMTFPCSPVMDDNKNPAKCQETLMKNITEIIKNLQ